MPVNRPALLRRDGPVGEIHRLPQHVENSAKRFGTDGHRDWRPGIDHTHPSCHPVGRLHRDSPYAVFAEVLFDFCHDIDLLDANTALRDDSDRVVDLGQALGKFDVDDGTDHLHDLADLLCRCCLCHTSVPTSRPRPTRPR